jgi:CRISPR-associated protein Cas1
MRRVTKIATPIAHLVGPGKLKVDNHQLAFARQDDPPLRLDTASLRRILCYGEVGISDHAFAVLFAKEIEVAWLNFNGQRCQGRLVGFGSSSTARRWRQFHALADESRCRELAARLVRENIASQAGAVRHYQRHGLSEAALVLRLLREWEERCATASRAELRGFEGAASAAWFGLLPRLLQAPWTFPGRVRRPPTDPVNALLSLGYTFLLQRVVARCEATGLDSCAGALHEFRAGRPSLGCDLMEPLRVPVVDRWVIGLCNQQMIGTGDFELDETTGGTRLRKDRFRAILGYWEQHWLGNDFDQAIQDQIDAVLAWMRADELPADSKPESDPLD